MNKDTLIWNWKTIKEFQKRRYNTLLYKHHIYSTLKVLECGEDKDDKKLYKVFFAKKHHSWIDEDGSEREEDVIFAIDPKMIQDMPIKVDMNACFQEQDNKNIVYRINPYEGYARYRLKPEKLMSFKEIVNTPKFKHSNEEANFLLRLIIRTAYTDIIFACVSTNSSFGKNSDVVIMDGLTGLMPLIKPGSLPALLRDLNPNGAVVFNETNSLTAEIKRVTERLIMDRGDGSTTFKNEKKASVSHNLKDIYDVEELSLLFFYNDLSQYKNEEFFFDNLWQNKDGVKNRLLQFKFNGELLEKFNKNIDVNIIYDEAEKEFMKFKKSIEYYKINKEVDYHGWRKMYPSLIKLTARQEDSFEAILKNLDKCCDTQKEFTHYELLLINALNDYKHMVEGTESKQAVKPKEEKNQLLKDSNIDDNVKVVKISDFGVKKGLDDWGNDKEYIHHEAIEFGFTDSQINKWLEEGEIFEKKPGLYRRL